MRQLQNISKARLKRLKKLLQKKGRNEEGAFLVEGARTVYEAITSDWIVDEVCVTDAFLSRHEHDRLLSLASEPPKSLWRIPEQDLKTISDTVTSQGIIASVRRKITDAGRVFSRAGETSTIIGLHNVSDPGNVGTILRTADWFGADAVICSGESVDIFNPKVVRSSMGALFHIPIVGSVDVEELISAARQHSYRIYATTVSGGKQLDNEMTFARSLILFGSEADGLSSEILRKADECITIPSFGKAESLNVAIAAGIVLACARISGSRD